MMLVDSPDSPDGPLDRPVLLFDPQKNGLIQAHTRREAGILSGELDDRRPQSEQRSTSTPSYTGRRPTSSASSRDLFGHRVTTPDDDRRMRLEERDLQRLAALHARSVQDAAERRAREPIF
jgi:hypothetical protein